MKIASGCIDSLFSSATSRCLLEWLYVRNVLRARKLVPLSGAREKEEDKSKEEEEREKEEGGERRRSDERKRLVHKRHAP